MSLGTVSLTAAVNPSQQWVLLTVACTGMTNVTIYRVTPDGTQAVRGAFNLEASDAANVADYEAPQNTPLTYFARVTDSVMTKESAPVVATGQIDRGGDVIFGLGNPLAAVPVYVVSFPTLTSDARRDIVSVIGRPDPVVVSDVRTYPSGVLTVATLTDATRNSVRNLLQSSVIAFSPYEPTYGFSDVWYFSVGAVNENRLSPIGSRPERSFELQVQRIAPPPADFLGPAFRTWGDALAEGKTWGDRYTSGRTWLQAQVV